MLGLEILDVVLGMCFVYLVLSLMCSAASELIATALNRRGKVLRKALDRLLSTGETGDLARRFQEHPLIRALGTGGRSASYIPAQRFALSILDLLGRQIPEAPPTIEGFRNSVAVLPESAPIRQTFRILLDEAGSDLKRLQEELEAWFDDSMDRVSGWYKRNTQWIVAGLAFLVSVAANADTLRLADTLSRNASIRQALVAQAETLAKAPPPASSGRAGELTERVAGIVKELGGVGLPFGWNRAPADRVEWLMKILGLLMTALAVSLGSPFWFDMLGKVVNVRAAGTRPPRGGPVERDQEAERASPGQPGTRST